MNNYTKERIVDLHKQGFSVNSIRKGVGLPHHKIVNFLIEEGYTPKDNRRIHISKETLEYMLSDGYNAIEIAEELGCSKDIIYARLCEYGIKLRDKKDE